MDIRSATRLDLPELAALHTEISAEVRALAPEGFGAPPDSLPGVSTVAAKFRDALDDSDCILLVAVERGRILGFVSGWREEHGDDMMVGPFLTIEYVEVREEARGRGVAGMLIEAMEREARQRGLERVDLLVWADNEPAREVYSRLGYTVIEHRMGKLLTGK